jgi:hypothetical protein
MPYTAAIDRTNPTCFLFLIDQSLSMSESLAGQPGQHKMKAAADTVNRVLNNLALRCSQGMNVRNYFDIGILGYGHAQRVEYDETQVYGYMGTDEVWRPLGKDDVWDKSRLVQSVIINVFPGTTLEWPFLSMSEVVEAAEIEDRNARESDGEGGTIEVNRKIPVWLQPDAGGHTPMCGALNYTAQSIQQWVALHPDSFPPTVINISDGEATDGDPEPLARQIMDLRTSDGNVLMFNCHLSDIPAIPVQYPDHERDLPDEYAKRMFRMSSRMPATARNQAATLGITVTEESRCYVYNADLVSLVQFLDIGTRGPSLH